jgi:integrase
VACIRKRRGRFVVDYRDAAGIRRWISCESRKAAEAVLAERLQESRPRGQRPTVDPDIRVADYAAQWLTLAAATLKPRTLELYRYALAHHLLPFLGSGKLRLLDRGQIKHLLAEKLRAGLSRGTVRILYATLRAMLNAAVDDALLRANPAARLGRTLKLVAAPATRQEAIKAMTREQLSAFFVAMTSPKASPRDRRYYPLFLCLARAGLRLGEALALEERDLDFTASTIRVERALSETTLGTPKSGHGRTVDMSPTLAAVLRRLVIERRTEALRRGQSEPRRWLFATEVGTPFERHNLRKVFVRLLKRAGLPPSLSPHCLRHTFASLLLQQGESPVYVQRQLGHASIKLTVDTYGKWLPIAPLRGGVAGLDDESGSRSGSNRPASAGSLKGDRWEDVDLSASRSGEPWWDRTTNPLLKRQVLYRLS